MSQNTKLIAGEPVEVLRRLLPAIEVTKQERGYFRVDFTTDIETGAAWQRAIERTAADLITTERFEPFDSRSTAAFTQLVIEVASTITDEGH